MSNEHNNAAPVEFGCHCDLERGMSPDGCVLDEGKPENCVHARRFSSKEQCVYWIPITPPAAAPAPAVPQGFDLLTKAHAQIRYLIDDLTTVVEDDGLVRYLPPQQDSLLYSNMIGALIPLAAQMAALLSATPAAPSQEPVTDEVAANAARYVWLRNVHIGDNPEFINLEPHIGGLDGAIDALRAKGALR